MRLPSEQFLHGFLHLGHAGLATDQDDFVDLGRLQAGILQSRLARADCPLDEIVDQRFKLGAGQFHIEMLGSVLIRGDERKIDVGLRRAGQLDLGLLGRILEALQGQSVVAQIDAGLLAELVRQIVHDALVEILAAEESVAVGRLDLEHAVTHLQNGNVERAAAEIVNRDLAASFLVQTVSQRSRRGLVDDAKHVEPGDAARVLGRLTLGVVEIGGNRDDRLLDLLSEISFRGLLHFCKDERADLARAVLLALHLDPSIAVRTGHDLVRDHSLVLLRDRVVIAPADEPLDREDGVFRIGDALPLGGLTDENLPAVCEGNHGGRRSCALGILDHFGRVAFHDGNARVGRSEIDPDCLGHDESPVQRMLRGGARDDRTCQPSAAARRGTISPSARLARRRGRAPSGRSARNTSPGPQGQAASLTSIFLASLRAGFGMVIFNTPFDMVA